MKITNLVKQWSSRCLKRHLKSRFSAGISLEVFIVLLSSLRVNYAFSDLKLLAFLILWLHTCKLDEYFWAAVFKWHLNCRRLCFCPGTGSIFMFGCWALYNTNMDTVCLLINRDLAVRSFFRTREKYQFGSTFFVSTVSIDSQNKFLVCLNELL